MSASWQDALTVVEKLAPTIASVLGGPLLGGGVAALEGVFGLTPAPSTSMDDRQAAVAAAISGATPEQLGAMRKSDQDFAARMAEAGFKDTETLAALTVQDTVSARVMQASNKSWTPPILTWLITLGFFGMIGLLFYVDIPKANQALVYSLTGTLGTAWLIAVHFWYGSTQGSQNKDVLLANSTPPSQ
jgi:hypothetical protein